MTLLPVLVTKFQCKKCAQPYLHLNQQQRIYRCPSCPNCQQPGQLLGRADGADLWRYSISTARHFFNTTWSKPNRLN